MHLVITLPGGLSDKKISVRAAQEGLWLWPLSAAYVGTNARQGFILGFGGTKADEMTHHVRRMRKVIAGQSGYGGRAKSGH
jgi:DNA-binding transcriptional MocR family regulator